MGIRTRTIVAGVVLAVVAALAPVGVAPAAAADPVDYSLTASAPATVEVGNLFNLGFSPAMNPSSGWLPYEVTFEVPAGLEVYNTLNLFNPDFGCNVTGRTVTCPGVDVYGRYVKLLAVVPGTYTIDLTITGTEGYADPVPDPTPNTASVTTTVVSSTKDMTLAQGGGVPGTVGEEMNLTASVYDNPRPAGDPTFYVDGTLTWDIPDELQPVSASFNPALDPPNPDIDGPFFEQGSCAVDGQNVSCTGLIVEGSYKFYSVRVIPLEAGTFPVSATFTPGPNQSEPVPDPRPNTATWNVVVEPASNGAIEGTVSGTIDSNLLAGVVVDAIADGSSIPAASATTSATGSYLLEDLAPGTYQVRFTPPAASGYLTQWHRGDGVASTRSAADAIEIDGSGDTVAISETLYDLDLGRVDLGAGSQGFWVPETTVYPGEETELLFYPSRSVAKVDGVNGAVGFPSQYVVTAPAGVDVTSAFPRWGAGGPPEPDSSCSVAGATVTCELHSTPREIVVNVVAESAGTATFTMSHTSATPEAVPDVLPNTDTADVEVAAPDAALSGTILDSNSVPLAGAWVMAYLPSDGWVPTAAGTWALTDGNGDFSFTGLAAGDYKLAVIPSQASGLANQWLENATGRATARTFTLRHGLEVDAGTLVYVITTDISGAVSGPAGPVSGALVSVYSSTDRFVASRGTFTAADGSYSLSGLPDDSYTILVTPPGSSGLGHRWYEDADRRGTATPVVTTGGQITGLDVLLGP